MSDKNSIKKNTSEGASQSSNNTYNNPTVRRRKRSVVVSDRKVRSTDVGVSGLYEVISEADLAFSPDTKVDAVTVFQVSHNKFYFIHINVHA